MNFFCVVGLSVSLFGLFSRCTPCACVIGCKDVESACKLIEN